jgi:hypothetical protein
MPQVVTVLSSATGSLRAHVSRLLYCSDVPIPGLFAAGALRVQRGHTNISSSYLADNHAHRHGGAVYVGTVGKDEAQATRQDLLQDIKECYSGNNRPALLLYGCNVTSNTAEASGGELSSCVHVCPGGHSSDVGLHQCVQRQHKARTRACAVVDLPALQLAVSCFYVYVGNYLLRVQPCINPAAAWIILKPLQPGVTC